MTITDWGRAAHTDHPSRLFDRTCAGCLDEHLDNMKAERDNLSAENAALRKDAERLDWLERYATPRVAVTISPPHRNGDYDAPWGVYSSYREGVYEGKTLRAAIDNAISRYPDLASVQQEQKT